MKKRTVVFFADGLEMCEALITVDLLRRAGIEVVTASVMGRPDVVSSHGVRIFADTLAEDVDYDGFDMIILPGGLPGTNHLADSEVVRQQCINFAAFKKLAAICAAPTVPGALHLLEGRQATCFPGLENKLYGAEAVDKGVVVDGNIITGRALGAAMPFALEIIKMLLGEEASDKVRQSIHLD